LAPSASAFQLLTYSTYLRDNFTPRAIAADTSGDIYLAGFVTVDPATNQATALIVKLNPQANQFLYQRYLGGSVYDAANAIAVDSAGDAYIAGVTQSPDFPVTAGGNFASAPASPNGQRSFVTKLDPEGNVIYSATIGGAAASSAQAIAVTAAGQAIVTGTCQTSGFPSTAGAYSIANTQQHPYLLELDPAGATVVFSATGIGGTALALDSAGDIYVAGSTTQLDYPTTAGAYQTAFPDFTYCSGVYICTPGLGVNQYVSKINPAASALIWSTAVSGSGNTSNQGLAVDVAGNVYLTGYAGDSYPYTVSVPSLPSYNYVGLVAASPFLTKLDPTAQTLLFSVPIGGAGLQLDTNGNLYVGGGAGLSQASMYYVPANLPALADVPAACLPPMGQLSPNFPYAVANAAYASQVNASTGALLATQFIQGSNVAIADVVLSGSTLWTAGPTALPDVPFTPGAIVSANLSPASAPGAYFGAVDFSQPAPAAGLPRIACIVDSANFAPAGAAPRNKLLTVLGSNLGPATPVTASGLTNSLGGDVVNFSATGTYTAPLLYVSATQVNLAVPLIAGSAGGAAMTLSVNDQNSAPREIPLAYAWPSVFQDFAATFPANGSSPGYVAVALNADGSANSAPNPASLGSAVSIFINGLTPNPDVVNAPLQLFVNHGWTVAGIAQPTPFVIQVNLEIPSALQNDFSCSSSGICSTSFILSLGGGDSTGAADGFSGLSFGGVVYVNSNQSASTAASLSSAGGRVAR
jgi:uncharacterized protein (TIGR03437 family)